MEKQENAFKTIQELIDKIKEANSKLEKLSEDLNNLNKKEAEQTAVILPFKSKD